MRIEDFMHNKLGGSVRRRFLRLFLPLVYFMVTFLEVVANPSPDDSLDFQKTLPAQAIWAVQGKDVELPCDVTPPTPQDSVNMVFWFKDSIGIPLYSLDARGGPLHQASHLAISDDLGSRSYFLTDGDSTRARLRIKNVQFQDEGVFRCRVDFTNSPTRNFKVNLTLVVQPSFPRIFDAQGHEVHNTAGPFLQGHELFLSCEVTGGRPVPSVTWWQNGSLIDTVVDSKRGAFTTVNQLFIPKVKRSLWNTKFQCRASSDELAGYKSKEVAITVYLMPQKVKISTPTELMSTRLPQLCRCETYGSYPPAKITWLLGNKPIVDSYVTVSDTADSTTSILTLQPTPEDDGKELVCRADNPRFPGSGMQDSKTVRVAYPPKATTVIHFQSDTSTMLTSTPMISSSSSSSSLPQLKEGDSIRFLCKTRAVPPAYKYTWYHNGHLVEYNESAGMLPTDHVLELRNLNKSSEGEYSCAASNSEGETLSEPLRLKIQYAPRCREGYEALEVGALPHETVLVKCHVDAYPATVKFSWTYNNSKNVLPVQGANRMNNNGVISQLQFTPGSGDLETLACWASNSIGRQETPCLFHLIPAKIPDPPHDCSLRKPCERCVEVICEAGKDGGLIQSFVLELNEITPPPERPHGSTTLSDQGANQSPPLRFEETEPVFRLQSLEPGREYQPVVYAVNSKGRSKPPVQLDNVKVIATRELPIRPGPIFVASDLDDNTNVNNTNILTGPAQHSLALILGALISAAAVVVTGVMAVTAVILRRRRTPATSPVIVRRRNKSKRQPEENIELQDAEHGFGEGFQRRSIEYRDRIRTSVYMYEDEDVNIDAGRRISQHITRDIRDGHLPSRNVLL